MIYKFASLLIACIVVLLFGCKTTNTDSAQISSAKQGVDRQVDNTLVIQGTVRTVDNKPIAGVNVVVIGTNQGTITDIEGRFKLHMLNRVGKLEISFVGYESQEFNIPVNDMLQVVLKEAIVTEEEIITGEENHTKEVIETEYDDASPSHKTAESRHPEIASMAMSAKRDVHRPSGVIIRPDGTPQPTPEPGQLTAGEWNDLNKWDDWEELLKNKDYSEMQDYWQLYPTSRYTVFIRNKNELPLQDIPVDLLNEKDEIVWTTRTDNTGKAELWAGLTTQQKSLGTYKAIAHVNSSKYTITQLTDISHGVNHLDIDIHCNTSDKVDILWVVDATGSMGDEIRYLQEELADVIQRSLTGPRKLDMRMGAVFYRDTEDEYLTRVSPLSADIQQTVSFIAQQSADGGGDYPEAVELALEEALAQQWSSEAVARILFLVLDAPPREDAAILIQLQEQIKEAAARGIKIIPVTASGINRQTEFLMKYLAIATNGTYVFITDHSGIGGAHLEPVVQDYEVEKLNDLLVRLINYYSQSNGCNPNETPRRSITLFPNPTSNFVNVQSQDPLLLIEVRSASGMLVLEKRNVAASEVRLDLQGLIDGVYTVRCITDGYEYSQPLILVNGR